MSADVEPEELQALLEDEPAPAPARGETVPRDFSAPLRLDARALEALRRRVRSGLPAVERAFAEALRRTWPLDVEELREIGCEGLFARAARPLCVVRFRVDGQPGWLSWRPEAALAAIEAALGAHAPVASEPRPFTRVERALLEQLLTGVARAACAALELAPQDLALVHDAEQLGSWRDGGAAADPGRLHVSLTVDGPGRASRLDLYLPCVHGPAPQATAAAAVKTPPRHAEGVDVELAAELGSTAVPLAELLRLEVGDVIPLDARVDQPLAVRIEGRPFALARLGARAGELALRIERLHAPDDD